ncbi:universal stress protein [Lichenibacterium dinghuense]|uniref:universal stress protein n=1 Tax=Lichenibacterium dinghuense TaxID=2895977 RepID=UPI001F2DF063|nr:universal stress protein [Lichenibacterium sp. 6Y81]
MLASRPGARACLEAAFAAAAAIPEAEVSALHVRIDPRTTILPTEEMLTDVRRREIESFEAKLHDDLRATFDVVSDALGPASFRWVDGHGTETASVVEHAREAALVVLALPPSHHAGEAQEAEHAALFDAGRPLLLVPHAYERAPVRRIAVAWHDDEKCRGAVTGVEPWLRRATTVEVLAIGDGDASVLEPARALMDSLEVKADFRVLDRGGATVGERLLSEAAHADWLVMGAFRRGRVLDWFLDSATEVVIHDLRIPVVMRH